MHKLGRLVPLAGALLLCAPLHAAPPAVSPSEDGTPIDTLELLRSSPASKAMTFPGNIVITVFPSPAPNAFSSPYWATQPTPSTSYTGNAMSSLRGNHADVLTSDPASYHVITDGYFVPDDVMVTSFPSWRGQANPASPFDAEYGNRLHCGMTAIGDGNLQFTLQDVLFMMTSSDNALNWGNSQSGTTFDGVRRIGVSYGPNHIPGDAGDPTIGAGDDIVYHSGEPDTTPVDAIFFSGSGNAYWPGGPGDPATGTDQDIIDSTRAWIYANDVSITCGYWIDGFQGSATLHLRHTIFSDGFEEGPLTPTLPAWSAAENAGP